MYEAADIKTISRVITRHVKGIGTNPTQAKDRNSVPTSNLSATGSRKVPSLEACDDHVRAIHPSARSLNPANINNHNAICNKQIINIKNNKHSHIYIFIYIHIFIYFIYYLIIL